MLGMLFLEIWWYAFSFSFIFIPKIVGEVFINKNNSLILWLVKSFKCWPLIGQEVSQETSLVLTRLILWLTYLPQRLKYQLKDTTIFLCSNLITVYAA